MGPADLPAEKGYSRISSSTSYDSLLGYGWLLAPVANFDTANEKLYKPALASGVLGKDSLVFRIDAPNGDYNLVLSLGNKDSIPMEMLVSVNGESSIDTVSAPWYRLAYKTVRRRISVKEGRIIISIAGAGNGVGLYTLELRSVTKTQPIDLANVLDTDTSLIKKARANLAEQLKKDTTNTSLLNQLDIVDKYLLACYYFDGGGWSWAQKQTGLSLIYRMYAAADLLEQVIADPEDPLYNRSCYLLAKIYYWLDQEDNNLRHKERARFFFSLLQEKYRENNIISMYLGQKIKDDNVSAITNQQAPRWAVYQHEAMQRMLKVIHWWVTEKQTDNGELGGKYGDDVEILRWWLPAVLGADDSLAKAGYKRLADGVWNSGILERGFARRVDDVEHSAELFRDTHPGMFLINYGDPEYVERCMISMQNFRDVWTGITPLGHRHFRSYYLSATEVVPQYPYGVDVAMNARALLPGLWAAWYNKSPSIIQLFEEWCKSWIADAGRSDNGKPAGVLPSAVGFATDRIGGDGPRWFDPSLTYSYYNWDHLAHVNELQYHLMGMYALTGNKYYLQTVNFYNGLMTKARNEKIIADTVLRGSIDWVKQQLLSGGSENDPAQNPMGKVFAMAKQVTSATIYDSLVNAYGQPYNQYSINNNEEFIERGLEKILQTLRYNLPLLTSEVKFTDRVYIPGINLLTGMYTGHFGAGYEYPALIASWKNTGKDVAVLIRGGSNKTVFASVYNFGQEKRVSMRTWQLQPGQYRVRMGIDQNEDGSVDRSWSDTIVTIKERVSDIPLKLPARELILLSVEQLRVGVIHNTLNVDLAITAREISIAKQENGEIEVSAVIHNIGNLSARNSKVVLTVDGQLRESLVIPSLEAPNDLRPRLKQVIFKMKPMQRKMHTMNVTVSCDQPEITTLNNTVSFEIDTEKMKRSF